MSSEEGDRRVQRGEERRGDGRSEDKGGDMRGVTSLQSTPRHTVEQSLLEQ